MVFKALAKDDPRDAIFVPDFKIGLTGVVTGVRQNFTGGTFSFSSGASDVNTEPTWDAGVDGWYADTLGFLVGPSTTFRFQMQAVDEWQRRDGSPSSISFDVGYPPCVQCLEILPDPSTPSNFPPDLDCYEGDDTSVGFTLGLLYQPSEQWSFGATYRSPGEMDYVEEVFNSVGLDRNRVKNDEWTI